MSEQHKCPAAGCEAQIDFDVMACKRHWFALPPDLRRRVGRAWRSGGIEAVLGVRREVVNVLSETSRD